MEEQKRRGNLALGAPLKVQSVLETPEGAPKEREVTEQHTWQPLEQAAEAVRDFSHQCSNASEDRA